MPLSESFAKKYEIDDLPPAPFKKVAECARKIGTEGLVLVKNEKSVLPFKNGEKISVFGRAQFEYLKSGTGSGGMVNTEYTVSIIEGLQNSGVIELNTTLMQLYKNYIIENPFDNAGNKWASHPFSQKEMPLSDETAETAAKCSNKALVIISRLCGEGYDFRNEKGAFLLTDTELEMLKTVRKHFEKMCVVLNVSNVIDCSWIEEVGVDSVMFVWHGGQEGGNSVADVLCGKATPSGKLTDTVAKQITDHPSFENFDPDEKTEYIEDIYVGYRYFETFAQEKVLYPFGYGLSYTTFSCSYTATENAGIVNVNATVKNTGGFSGAEVIEVYAKAPQGKLGKPYRVLAGYKKTNVLKPQEETSVSISFDIKSVASYDDSGITGNKSCYILEKGDYEIYVGTDVRSAENVYTYHLDSDKVTEHLSEIGAPVIDFERIKPCVKDGKVTVTYEKVPKRSVDLAADIEKKRKSAIVYTGDRDIKFSDVAENKATLNEFIAQLSRKQLVELLLGEGMCSPKVKSGCGGAIGGLTKSGVHFGIPAACVTDGPSGLRFDSGEKATSIPCGTLLACTWNDEAVEELFSYLGVELYVYGVDALLGPGTNIHRHPLCGRNFEYFSEDPFISGKMCAAEAKGLAKTNTTVTIKHFACNNIEQSRNGNNSVLSERALREIYLKCFEIPVKAGDVKAVMTSYNLINGIHANSRFDINTTALRDEWGFDGIVMTDWWPHFNFDNDQPSKLKKSAMVRAQNDLSMCVVSAEHHEDDILEQLDNGTITIYEVQRNVKNILKFILSSNAYKRYLKNGSFTGYGLKERADTLKTVFEQSSPQSEQRFSINLPLGIVCLFEIDYTSHREATAQTVITINCRGDFVGSTVSVNGLNGGSDTVKAEVIITSDAFNLKYNPDDVTVNAVRIKVAEK